ncbi:hypothetical protein [Terriglobus aquaticus]|uniref:Single-stranded DNA-binding protein n=1 Tax=Terriglobus aquaticus TaxID=940139 RepID=A0ABW9KH28_9BACT|nr:hypothetical protein [Terriglobus aquaticus]
MAETGTPYRSVDAFAHRRLRNVHAMAVRFPEVAGHPNRVPFSGVLTRVDEPSDKAPSGARGHRVVLTRAAAEAALPSLLGMAVDWKSGWDGHDAKQKCGIVTAAELDGNDVRVEGYLFARDWAEMMNEIHAHGDEALGMSYELADAHVDDMRAQEWRLNRVTFTGAAILLRSKAAYRNTSFRVDRSGVAKPAAEVELPGAPKLAEQRTHSQRQPLRQAERPRAGAVRPVEVPTQTTAPMRVRRGTPGA